MNFPEAPNKISVLNQITAASDTHKKNTNTFLVPWAFRKYINRPRSVNITKNICVKNEKPPKSCKKTLNY